MLVVYAATLAPGVTFWDAGEFIAAAHSLGIPHPPGTPLFVLLLNVWARLFGTVLPYAVATNLFSAACAAAAAGTAAWLLASRRGMGMAAVAGAVCAAAMSTVWMNATETEVYSASLLLAMLTLAAAERSSRDDGYRWLALTAYLVALSVPLHLSALVATPAAIVLAAQRAEGIDIERAAMLGGVWLLTIGAGRVSLPLAAIGVVAVIAAAVALGVRRGARRAGGAAAALLGVSVVALSAVLFLLIRARFDPFINQGDPSTWAALSDAVARRQYDVAPLWPRQAPAWIQLANVGQYADWQVALGLGATVLPSVGRSIATVTFLALGVYGAARHRENDRRTWRALLVLLACGSLGVAAYLNLKAGPSIGAGVLPDSAPHEARERDYFFALAFWTWGLWAGYGAVALARRLRGREWMGLAFAGLPIALNWSAVSRRHQPEATLPTRWAASLLEATPRNGVLFAAGDNDTYPVWYAQEVLGVRRDVRVVTLPLIPAGWYRAELVRRGGLIPAAMVDAWDDDPALVGAEVARRALAGGRPVAASVYVDRPDREAIGRAWTDNGITFVLDSNAGATSPLAGLDTAMAAKLVTRLGPMGAAVRPSIDGVDDLFQSLLGCPSYVLERARGKVAAALDSTCNLR
ncbi:MAG TPA: DUF2723 domain-containing protein [Gemmatimonadaceae bacterium]|nr:DUF2723 domain-containing protein [Gemmatimonadaceae bacterium]